MLEIFKQNKIIPVLIFDKLEYSLKVSEILLKNDFNILEITLRTKNSLKCIEEIVKRFPEAIVGAGTVINPSQFSQIKNAGCKFAISPGFSENLIKEAKKQNIFYLPGAITPSEIIALNKLKINFIKFFHSENFGGIKTLKVYYDIFPQIKFCPTGGINQNNFKEYLKTPNVACIGGSWIAQKNMTIQEIKKQIALLKNEI